MSEICIKSATNSLKTWVSISLRNSRICSFLFTILSLIYHVNFEIGVWDYFLILNLFHSRLRKRVDTNSKRSYTEEELQAALRDIQSGKLGTRRAAVIYGIPRSTLRNKVYKLANESKSRTHCKVNQTTVNSTKTETIKDSKDRADLDVPVFDNLHKQNLTSASNSLRQLLKHTITQKAQTASKSSDKTKNSFPHLSNIDTMAELQMLGNLECSQSLGPVLSHVSCIYRYFAFIN